MSKPTPIILCADDFGIAPGVSRGIVELVKMGRLSAVSCMATSKCLAEYAPDLGKHAGRVDIGLHLVLTDPGRPVSVLVQQSLTGRLSRPDVEAELTRQLDTFMGVFGRPPDFLDGHHHIHQLPGIRDAVFDLAVKRLHDCQPWLRSTAEIIPLILRRGIAPLKAMQIGFLGRDFRRRAERLGLRVNSGFSGIYDFSGDVPYARLFKRFVADAGPGTLVMCHPGHVDDELRNVDSLTDQREVELGYFASDEFARLLENRNLRLAGFAEQ